MRPLIFRLHNPGRVLSRWRPLGLGSRILVRSKTVDSAASKKSTLGRGGSQKFVPRPPTKSPRPKAEATPAFILARTKPQSVVIYYAGNGKIMFLGMVRFTAILIFVVSCGVVAPAYFYSDAPWYFTPAVLIGGMLPMIFVSYTYAPFINQVHLALPGFAQHSREAMMSYLQKVPRTADLSIETMRFNLFPRRSHVSVSQLVSSESKIRPVSFRNTNPKPGSWWRGGDSEFFFAPEKSTPAKRTSKFFPEVWEQVFSHIKKNPRKSV